MLPLAPDYRSAILPGGPREVQRTYTAPFARANREEDYRIVWAFFEDQQA